MGVDSLNLSPDVYDSYRYTTVAKAVEESKRWVGCSIVCHITIVIICISPPHLPFSATKASANQSAIRSNIRAPNTPEALDTFCCAAAERRTQIRRSAAALRGCPAAQHGGRCSLPLQSRGFSVVEVTAVCVSQGIHCQINGAMAPAPSRVERKDSSTCG